MYILYFIIIVCLWGDHNGRHAHAHTPSLHMIDLRENSDMYRHKTGKVSAVPLWQGSGPRLTSLIDSTFLSMKMTPWRLILSGPGYRQVLGIMVMACGLLNIL